MASPTPQVLQCWWGHPRFLNQFNFFSYLGGVLFNFSHGGVYWLFKSIDSWVPYLTCIQHPVELNIVQPTSFSSLVGITLYSELL